MSIKELKDFIEDCVNDDLIDIYSCPNDNGIGVSKLDYNPYKTIMIDAETIGLHQKGLGITIDIPNDILGKIENIEINGFIFVKEKSDE